MVSWGKFCLSCIDRDQRRRQAPGMSVDSRKSIRVLFLSLWIGIILVSFNPIVLAEDNSLSPSLPWVQTNGPCGGYISDIAIDPANPSILYAAGSSEGVYKSTDGGNSWSLLRFSKSEHTENIIIDPKNPSVLYCDCQNLSKSTDGGLTWHGVTKGFGDTASVRSFSMDPTDSNILYMAGQGFEGSGAVVFKTENGGQNWRNISRTLNAPSGSDASALAVLGKGKVFVGVNDWSLTNWGRGKVFYSDNDGRTWRKVDFGQTEDRFIFSIFASPFNLKEVWISEGPLHNDPIEQPLLYKSSDGGRSWKPLYINVGFDCTQVRVIGASSDGRVYVSGGGNLFFTKNGGLSFRSIDPPPGEMSFMDFTNIAVHPSSPDILFLPLRAGGIAYSENGGINWSSKNNGILNTSINLLAVDSVDPRVVYAASSSGEGTFRTDDYGEAWQRLNKGGIKHPWMDEVYVDPVEPSTVWLVTDTATIYKSINRGEKWTTENRDYLAFRFSSVYALAFDPKDPERIYGSKNGFGIFRMDNLNHPRPNWKFLRESVDYTYSIVIDPEKPNILYSGYNKKPFEERAKITKSSDYGESWQTVFEPKDSKAVTSLAIDPHNPKRVYAGCTGKLGIGGTIWVSENRGARWTNLNPHFTFAAIHALAVDPHDSRVVYAGAWDGGVYKTTNGGGSWHPLPNAPLSVSEILIDPENSDVLYAADRIGPRVLTSRDGGDTWKVFFDAGAKYSAITTVDLSPQRNTLYVGALGKGLLRSSLFEIESQKPEDITGYLTGAVVAMAIDKKDPESIYVALDDKHLYHSEDGGETWRLLKGFPEVDVLDLKINEENSSILYAATVGPSLSAGELSQEMSEERGRSGIYKSPDGGETWSYMECEKLENTRIRELIVEGDEIFAAAQEGIFFSNNGGKSFKDISGTLSFKDIGVLAKAEDRVYLGTYGGGVYRADGVKRKKFSWRKTSGPRPNISNIMVKIHPENSEIIFASSYPGGFFVSEDRGKTWHERNLGSESFMGIIGRPASGIFQDVALVTSADDPGFRSYYPFDVSSHNPDLLYLGVYGGGLYRSINGASTWEEVLSLNGEYPSLHITSIKIDEYDPERVYISSEEGVFFSTDSGLTWQSENRGLPTTDVYSILMIPERDEIYIGTRGYGVFKWNEKANRWIQLQPFGNNGVLWPVWNNRPLYQYTSLLIHPEDNNIMYFGVFPSGIYKSIDGGRTWREKNVGSANDGVMSLVFHLENPEIIFAGTYNGINVSWDAGDHWQTWDKGWPDEQWVFSIDFDPQNPDIMYAASKNGANMGEGERGFHGTVMKSIDGGATWFEITRGLNKNNEFYKIIVDRFDSKRLYLATQGEGVFISLDAGESWRPWNKGLTNLVAGTNGNNVTNTLQLSADGRVLYFGTAGSGVFRTQLPNS